MKPKFVMVTTKHRGVFSGILVEYDKERKSAILEECRMCVWWEKTVHGVLGLAATGPDDKCLITKAVPVVDPLEDVTGVFGCTDEAAERWREEPWCD